MQVDLLTKEAHAILRENLTLGFKASPLSVALAGWLCDVPTVPEVAEIQRSADGTIWLRQSDEKALTHLCSFSEFLDQITMICHALQMTDEHTKQMVAWARHRLG